MFTSRLFPITFSVFSQEDTDEERAATIVTEATIATVLAYDEDGGDDQSESSVPRDGSSSRACLTYMITVALVIHCRNNGYKIYANYCQRRWSTYMNPVCHSSLSCKRNIPI